MLSESGAACSPKNSGRSPQAFNMTSITMNFELNLNWKRAALMNSHRNLYFPSKSIQNSHQNHPTWSPTSRHCHRKLLCVHTENSYTKMGIPTSAPTAQTGLLNFRWRPAIRIEADKREFDSTREERIQRSESKRISIGRAGFHTHRRRRPRFHTHRILGIFSWGLCVGAWDLMLRFSEKSG